MTEFGRSAAGRLAAAEPELEGLCFTLHLISTIRQEWRQPLAVAELPLQALYLSWWIFIRMHTQLESLLYQPGQFLEA